MSLAKEEQAEKNRQRELEEKVSKAKRDDQTKKVAERKKQLENGEVAESGELTSGGETEVSETNNWWLCRIYETVKQLDYWTSRNFFSFCKSKFGLIG